MSKQKFSIKHNLTYEYDHDGVVLETNRIQYHPRPTHEISVTDKKIKVLADGIEITCEYYEDQFSNINAGFCYGSKKIKKLEIFTEVELEYLLSPATVPKPNGTREGLYISDYDSVDIYPFTIPCTFDPYQRLSDWVAEIKRTWNNNTDDCIHAIFERILQLEDGENHDVLDKEVTKTLDKGGSCRDKAWLMIEAVRRLGVAAYFVQGYRYDIERDSKSHDLHAWLKVYRPNIGWKIYDPSYKPRKKDEMDILIPTAIGRHPSQVNIYAGVFSGARQFKKPLAKVEVTKLTDQPVVEVELNNQTNHLVVKVDLNNRNNGS